MKNIPLFFIALLCNCMAATAQSFSINTDGSLADTSSILDVKSTTKGLLIPRMTKTQRNQVFSPANGLLIYQTGPDSAGFHYYDGNNWKWISDYTKTDSLYWSLNGNTGTLASSMASPLFPINGNYTGTNDGMDFVIGTNQYERIRFKGDKSMIGIADKDPRYALDLTLSPDAIATCSRNGLRMKYPASLTGCDGGYFMGYSSTDPFSSSIQCWNFDGNSSNNAFQWGFGTDQNVGLSMSLENYRLGIAQTSAKYAIDIKLSPDTQIPCFPWNGIRMITPGTSSACGTGFLIGVNPNTPDDAIIINYGSGTGSNASIRFGIGASEVMRIVPDKVGINITNPEAVLHLTEVAGSTRNGIRITNVFSPTTSGSYFFGREFSSDDLEISTAYNNAMHFYTNSILRMIIDNAGSVKIGSTPTTPNSTLQVEGTIAVGVSNGIAGGSSISPASLANLGSYISLNPSAGLDYYQLPDPSSCTGRVCYIRNNSSSDAVTLISGISNLCPGNSSSCTAAYIMPVNANGKTVIAISDGSNWTIGQIN